MTLSDCFVPQWWLSPVTLYPPQGSVSSSINCSCQKHLADSLLRWRSLNSFPGENNLFSDDRPPRRIQTPKKAWGLPAFIFFWGCTEPLHLLRSTTFWVLHPRILQRKTKDVPVFVENTTSEMCGLEAKSFFQRRECAEGLTHCSWWHRSDSAGTAGSRLRSKLHHSFVKADDRIFLSFFLKKVPKFIFTTS